MSLLVEFRPPHEIGAGFWYLLGAALAAVGAGLCAFQSAWHKPLWIFGLLTMVTTTVGLGVQGLTLSHSDSASAQAAKPASSTKGVYQVGVCVQVNTTEDTISLRWQTDQVEPRPGMTGSRWHSFSLERFGDQHCGVIGPLEENRVTTVTVTEPRGEPWVVIRFDVRYLSGDPTTSVARVYQSSRDGKYHFRVIATANLNDDIPTIDVLPITDPASLLPPKPPLRLGHAPN